MSGKQKTLLIIVMLMFNMIDIWAFVPWDNQYNLSELNYAKSDPLSANPRGKNHSEKLEKKTVREMLPGKTERIGVIATVNGDSITIMDLLEVCGGEEARLARLFKGAELEDQIKKLRLKTLKMLVDRKLIYQEFNEKGYKLPKEFVEENLDNIIDALDVDNRHELEKMLEKHGSNMKDFRATAYENAAVDALTNDVCFRDVYITPKQVYDYYENNKKEFTFPDQVRLQLLKVKARGHEDDLNTLLAHLEKLFKSRDEKEFNDAVLLYSDGPNIENNGDIGWVDNSKLRNEFRDLVKSANIGDIFGPVKTEHGYYFIRLSDIKRPKTKPFEDVKEQIRNRLTNEQKEKDYNAFIAKLRKKAYIKRYL